MRTAFDLNKNCWRINTLDHAALLVDCADFYRAIHWAMAHAEHSIFILGWEIDSNTRLLRGNDEKKSNFPSVVVELLAWKARTCPKIKIYLLRWDSSVCFLNEREIAAELAWTTRTPENLHICMDATIPLGGSHHQKIIVVDDQLVFTGGMDIARQRWDERSHSIQEPERKDANGEYGPYHDVQIALDGPIVRDFSELVRWRWRRAAGYEALPAHRLTEKTFPVTVSSQFWRDFTRPQLENMSCAIALTIPQMEDVEPLNHIKKMYLDLIERTDRFLYIENQFLSCGEIADAINRSLKRNYRLNVLLVSSYDPGGILEREGMWAARIDFKNRIEMGVKPGRVRMACSGITGPDGQIHYKRIHSKILVSDDRYFMVSSSNISRRSMGLDTECDVVLESSTQMHAAAVSRLRNDLIAEHTGMDIMEVGHILKSEGFLSKLFKENPGRYNLHDLDDSKFTDQTLKSFAIQLADPPEPFLGKKSVTLNPQKHRVLSGVFFSLLLIGAFLVGQGFSDGINPLVIKDFLIKFRSSPWALPIVCLAYVIASFTLFPVTLLSILTAAALGTLWGPIYGMIGAMVSTSLMFWIGRRIEFKQLRKIAGDRIRKVDAMIRRSGVLGVVIIRFLPIAPFSVVNLAAGMSSVRFSDFLLGSFFGFLPGLLAKSMVGDSLFQVFLNPDRQHLRSLILGLAIWSALIFISYVLVKKWREKNENQACNL